MSMAASHLLYLLRWGLFLVRWMLYMAYGALQFVSKPGSRLIVPALLAGAAYFERMPLASLISGCLSDTCWHHLPEPVTPARAIWMGVVVAICVGVTVAPYVFHVGWTISAALDVFSFAVKLGALLLFIGFGVVVYYGLPLDAGLLHYLPFGLADTLPGIDWRHWGRMPGPGLPVAILIIGLLLASCVYAALSRLLALVLGAFPPFVPPLRPLRKLRVKARAIQSVPVRFAVPKLPRRANASPVASLPMAESAAE